MICRLIIYICFYYPITNLSCVRKGHLQQQQQQLTFRPEPLDPELIDDGTIVQLMGIDRLSYPVAIIRAAVIDEKRAPRKVHPWLADERRGSRVPTGVDPKVGHVGDPGPVTQPELAVVQAVHVDGVAEHGEPEMTVGQRWQPRIVGGIILREGRRRRCCWWTKKKEKRQVQSLSFS